MTSFSPLQWHPEGSEGGQGEVAADAEKSAALYRRAEERAGGSASLDEKRWAAQSHRRQGLDTLILLICTEVRF